MEMPVIDGWELMADNDDIHVVPTDDVIQHRGSDRCECFPDFENERLYNRGEHDKKIFMHKIIRECLN